MQTTLNVCLQFWQVKDSMQNVWFLRVLTGFETSFSQLGHLTNGLYLQTCQLNTQDHYEDLLAQKEATY